MNQKINNVSDEAVKKATGKTWGEWIKILEKIGKNAAHKDIAKHLQDKFGLSGWWAQNVTVGFEKAKGMRILGETKDAGFQIGVQRTLPIESKKAWEFLLSPKILPIWLGTNSIVLETGESYHGKSIQGEVRSVDPGKKIRLTWQPAKREQSTTLQLYLVPTGERTSVRFHHEKLHDAKERQAMKTHWQQVLTKLEATLNESK